VNITAGPDFAIDEFETVGNAVKAFASENATVVVGTVIDMELTDELRVTVVATGIGAERKPDIALVSSEGARLSASAREYHNAGESRAVGGTDGNQALKADESVQPGNDLEYLDIPAFLRKQAD
jgi:cell division protein FtsZ